MKCSDKKAWIKGAILAAYAATAYYAYQNPDEARAFILNRANDLNNINDTVIKVTDWNGNGCGLTGCISIAGYLKSKISEEPLNQGAARALPSFIGGEHPASPFDYQI